MNYWLHRISHHIEISDPLLKAGYLTIGFSDFAEQTFIDELLAGETWEKRWPVIEKWFDDQWGTRPRTRHNLWRFVESFKKGDWIIVPSTGNFSIYELTGDKSEPIGDLPIKQFKDWNQVDCAVDGLIKRNEVEIDLGFFWRVKPIQKNISRYDYADALLTSRMKILNTNAWIGDLEKSILSALSAARANTPINLRSKIIDVTAKEILSTLKSELNPDKFEKVVKWYLERVGADKVYIPAKNERDKEGDADVIAIFEPIKTIIYVQAKFHTGITDEWAIMQVTDYNKKVEARLDDANEALDDGYSRIMWVVSSADNFNPESIRLGKEEKVQLINGLQFATMLLDAGITNIDKSL